MTHALPPSWATVPLGSVLSRIEAGASFRCEERPPREQETGVAKVSAVTWGEYDEEESKTVLSSDRIDERFLIRPGDFLFSRANTISLVGACVIARRVNRRVMLSDKILRFHFAGAEPAYVLHFLRSPAGRSEIERLSTGNQESMRNIGQDRIKAIQLPLPPLAEQRRIIAALEEHLSDVDAAVAGLKRARANLRRLRAATTRAAVDGSLLRGAEPDACAPGPDPWSPAVPSSWGWATVDDVAEIVEYGSSAKTRDEDADGIPVLRMGNIVDGALSWEALKYLPSKHHEFPRLMLRAGDVLFNRTNSPELVGKTAVYRAGCPRASFASYLLRVRLGPRMHPEFFSACLNSTYGRTWIATVVSQQVGQANVNGTKLRALRVPVPPVDEQFALVAELERRLSAAERAVVDIDIQLARASRLRQSILTRAFTGRLIRQYTADEPASVLFDQTSSTSESTPTTRPTSRVRATRSRA